MLINNRQLLLVYAFIEQPVKCSVFQCCVGISADVIVLVLSVLSSFICAEKEFIFVSRNRLIFVALSLMALRNYLLLLSD